jgi:flagellar hook-length control protein FliK
MTTDRPTATRATALPQRAYSAGQADRQAPPSDAFSALLGAATPRSADAPRPEARPRRDDAARPQRAEEPKPAAAAKPAAKDEPKADAPTTEPTPTEETAEEPKPRLVTPDIFALQLASPLPTTPTAVPTAPQAAVAVPAEGETSPAIPAFPQLHLLNGTPTAEVPTGEPTPAATPGTPGGPGGIPLSFLTGMTPVKQAEAPVAPLPVAPQAEVPADVVAPQLDAAAFTPPSAGGEQASSDTPQQQQNPQAPANTAMQTAKPADAPAPAPTTQPVAQPAPVAAVAPQQPTSGLQRAVPLYRAPESAAHMIQLAAERGVTHARLNLKPVELGGIEVRLKTTPEGITAQLVADSPEAAKLLSQAADDLRRGLAERDVNLLSLDVTTQQDYQQQQAGSKQADIFGDQLPGQQIRRVGLHGDAGLTESPVAADTTLVLPNGVHVDVLA